MVHSRSRDHSFIVFVYWIMIYLQETSLETSIDNIKEILGWVSISNTKEI